MLYVYRRTEVKDDETHYDDTFLPQRILSVGLLHQEILSIRF